MIEISRNFCGGPEDVTFKSVIWGRLATETSLKGSYVCHVNMCVLNSGTFHPERITGAVTWDLQRPWCFGRTKYYEQTDLFLETFSISILFITMLTHKAHTWRISAEPMEHHIGRNCNA